MSSSFSISLRFVEAAKDSVTDPRHHQLSFKLIGEPRFFASYDLTSNLIRTLAGKPMTRRAIVALQGWLGWSNFTFHLILIQINSSFPRPRL
jgi:hypothetical protein